MMEFGSFERAASKTHICVRQLRQLLGFYDYSDSAHSAKTDRILTEFLLQKLDNAYHTIFEIKSILFSLSIDTPSMAGLEALGRELEHSCDHLLIRDFGWSDPGYEIIERLILIDKRLVEQAQALDLGLTHLYTACMKAGKRTASGHTLVDTSFLAELTHEIHAASAAVEDVLFTFREREAICNLRPLSYQLTLNFVRKSLGR